MPAPRQQRSARNRRAPSAVAPPLTPLPVPHLVTLTAHTIELEFRQLASPANTVGSVIPMQLNGTPLITRALDATLPTGATINGARTRVTLTYGGANLGATETFRASPYDPNLRTSVGGFAAPAVIGQEGGPCNIVTPQPSATAPNTVHITASDPGAPIFLAPLAWLHTESGTAPLTATATGPLAWDLVFAGLVPSGDHISYTGPIVFAAPLTALSFSPAEQAIG